MAAQAATLSPSQALNRINASTEDASVKILSTPSALRHTASIRSNNGTPAMYVFSDPQGGYVIAAADDVAAPVLGYVDNGNYDYDALPDAMKWWLSEYAEQIQEASASAESYKYTRPAEFTPITPLINTLWDQNSPYNLYTPVIDDTQSPTGCAATAMAQQMRFFSYPANPTGAITYSMNGTPMSMTFDGLTFDWANMTYRYGANSTEAQKQAVSLLMKACGYSIQSTYGQYETAASVYYWAPALIEYFDYAPSMQPLNRIFFTLEDWEEIIYKTLADGVPVLYSGLGSVGGHAFLCDGYQGDGYFHFNWGWSGISDGYFLLSALNPSALGTGGGDGGFNSGQIAVINAVPNYPGAEMIPMMGVGTYADITYSNVSKNFTLTKLIYNYSPGTLTARLGFEIEAEDGTSIYAGADKAPATFEVGNGIQSYARKPSQTLADGTYKVYPAFAVENADGSLTWKRAMVQANRLPYWTLVMESGKGTISNDTPAADITVTNLHPTTKCYRGQSFRLQADLTNNSSIEFINDIYVLIFDAAEDGTRMIAGKANPVDIPVGETLDFEAVLSLTTGNVGIGTRYMVLATAVPDATGAGLIYTEICPRVAIDVLSPADETTLVAEEFYVKDADAVNPDEINLCITAKCTAGYYANPLRVWIRKSDATSWSPMKLTPVIYLDEGESTTFTFTFAYPDAIPGEKYTIISNYIYGDSQRWFGTTEFTAAVDAAVDVVESDAENCAIEYYNLQGIRVDQPTKGCMYIVRQSHSTKKIIY